MAIEQYKKGTVRVVQGSQLVYGDTDVNWVTAGIHTSHKFKLRSDGAPSYTVATVRGATSLRLSSNYVEASQTGRNYVITRSFTPNRSYARLFQGDSAGADILRSQVIDPIDTDIGAIYDGTATLNAVVLGTPTAPTYYWRMYMNASYELCFDYKGVRKAHVGTLTGSWIQ